MDSKRKLRELVELLCTMSSDDNLTATMCHDASRAYLEGRRDGYCDAAERLRNVLEDGWEWEETESSESNFDTASWA